MSTDALTASESPAAPPAFDSGGEVPSEYDVFCEGCGYSLAGIVADRCPECGQVYDPNALPFARIPWLHRRRIGRARAYRQTAWMVVAHPRRFAGELCRPVRISAADAMLFRRVTLRIAVLSVILAMSGVFFVMAGDQLRLMSLRARVTAGLAVIFYGVSTAAILALGTDMPVFIWRGLPTRPPSELAPVHHYAAAPLALMPFVGVVAVTAACVLRFLPNSDEMTWVLSGYAVFASLAIVAVFLWVLPLVLMRAATGSPARRVWALALYLPVHWFMMAFMVGCGAMLCVILLEGLLRSF